MTDLIYNKNRVSYESKYQNPKNHQPMFRLKWTIFPGDSCLPIKMEFLASSSEIFGLMIP